MWVEAMDGRSKIGEGRRETEIRPYTVIHFNIVSVHVFDLYFIYLPKHSQSISAILHVNMVIIPTRE